MDPPSLPLPPTTTCMMFFGIWGTYPVQYFYKDNREEGITRGCLSPFHLRFSPSDDAAQPRCNSVLLYVHQTIIYVLSTFVLHFCHCLCGVNGEMWNRIVMTVSDLYFYFKILYWIVYISNNAIILPVCTLLYV